MSENMDMNHEQAFSECNTVVDTKQFQGAWKWEVTSNVAAWDPMWTLVQVLIAVLRVQLPANEPG